MGELKKRKKKKKNSSKQPFESAYDSTGRFLLFYTQKDIERNYFLIDIFREHFAES